MRRSIFAIIAAVLTVLVAVGAGLAFNARAESPVPRATPITVDPIRTFSDEDLPAMAAAANELALSRGYTPSGGIYEPNTGVYTVRSTDVSSEIPIGELTVEGLTFSVVVSFGETSGERPQG